MITRRKFALAAVSPALSLKAQEPPPYQGSLAKFENQVDAQEFDSLAWTRKRYEEMPRRLRFQAKDRKAAEAWQKKLRAKLTELMGGFPPRVSLNAKILETRDFPGYKRDTVIFESRPGLGVFGYLLIPKSKPGPHPIVVSVPGHGRGVDDIAGIDDKGRDRTEKVTYQYDYAIQLVEHGMASLAIEPLGFGCRRDPESRKKGLSTSSCQPSAGAALLFGETMIGWRVWDVMRALDYAATRRELDINRAGCMGISGGGMVTAFASALEPRIRAAFVSGYMNTFRDSILSLSHCIDNYIPGVLQWCEEPDVVGLIAPRPLWCESGEKDPIFPLPAFEGSFAAVKHVYEVFGVPDLCGREIHSGPHVFSGKQGLPFLARHLNA